MLSFNKSAKVMNDFKKKISMRSWKIKIEQLLLAAAGVYV
jgi:hypothetical protein